MRLRPSITREKENEEAGLGLERERGLGVLHGCCLF
jgi:hypothetical protein